MSIDSIKRHFKEKHELEKHEKRMLDALGGRIDYEEHLKAMIIKQVHAIEKGLCSENLRLGFGLLRIEAMLDYLKEYLSGGGDPNSDECRMAKSVLRQYFELHDKVEWKESPYLVIREKAARVLSEVSQEDGFGGSMVIRPRDQALDDDALEEIIRSRHSIRSFSAEQVDAEKLKKALELAMRAPSACNRQPTRVYILHHDDFDLIQNWTGGVKTFIDQVDKLLIITSQMSAFEKDEYYQYTVSAGIFVGYLTLTLHAKGIGNCVLQRSLIGNGTWNEIRQQIGIPENEQSICAIAIGVPKTEVKVPVSKRLSYDRVVSSVELH